MKIDLWTYIMNLFGKNCTNKNVATYNLGKSKHVNFIKLKKNDPRFKTIFCVPQLPKYTGSDPTHSDLSVISRLECQKLSH